MPKKQHKTGRAGKRDSAVVELHFNWNGSLASGTALASLNATGLSALSTRFLSIGDAYAYFKYRSFKFRLHPANNTGVQSAGFVAVVDTSPSTVAQVAELINSVPMDPATTTPSEWIRVSKEELSGPFPWYKTIDGLPDSTEEYPGRFIVAGVGTDAFLVEFRVVVELKEGVAPANTPEELALVLKHLEVRKARALNKARQDMLSVLAPVAPFVSTKP